MYRDNTLIPSEAIRLLALCVLATRECPYAELAHEVRHFVGHVVGPSLDLVGAPIEVLKIEDLIEEAETRAAEPDSDAAPPLGITEAGSTPMLSC
jgi:hypothetical protein